jgi:hypothetical protein
MQALHRLYAIFTMLLDPRRKHSQQTFPWSSSILLPSSLKRSLASFYGLQDTVVRQCLYKVPEDFVTSSLYNHVDGHRHQLLCECNVAEI